MKGKNIFSSEEISSLIQLIEQRCNSPKNEQKAIRDKMRKLGFYGGHDFCIHDCTVEKFKNLLSTGKITEQKNSIK